MNETNETLGQRISRLRAERGMSQGDLADALEISRQSVSKWETDTSTPELDKLIRLAELFDLSMDALVLGKEDAPPAPADPIDAPPAADHTSGSVRPGHRKPPISQTQKNVGLGLIGISVLICMLLFVFYAWGGLLTGLILSSPLWGCGILCLTVRRRIGLWCAWLVYILITGYLYYATGTSRGSIWNITYLRYIDNPILLVVVAAEYILLILLYLSSFISFKNIRCPIRLRMKTLVGAYIGCVVGYGIFYGFFETWLPDFIIIKYYYTEVDGGFRLNYPEWIQTYRFAVSIIDLFLILALIIGAVMLYNEHKAAKLKTE